MFTVKQLSKLANITPRTLHYYDEIGLLKPTQIGKNGYRYYAEEALLRLQQILLYRELDMPLEAIKKIIQRQDFDAISALKNHKEMLRKRVERMQGLIRTVDDTILHLQGKKEMNPKQLFEMFSDEQQAEYEKEVMELYDPATVKASIAKWKKNSDAEKKRIFEEGNVIYQDFVNAIPKGASSPEAQACVERWRQHMEYFWVPNDDQLVGLADGYNHDPRFKANFDKIDPRLAGFVGEAVKVYVKNRKK